MIRILSPRSTCTTTKCRSGGRRAARLPPAKSFMATAPTQRQPFLIASGSAEDRGDLFFDSLPRSRANVLQRPQHFRMGHPRTQIRPAIRLVLNLDELRPLFI